MVLDLWFLYVAAISVVLLIPGPLSLFMMHNAINYGIVNSYPGILGGTLASSVYLIVSATGLGVLLAASDHIFSTLKLLGAFYLLYIGCKTIKDAISSRSTANDKQELVGSYSRFTLFRQAYLLGASNPKDIIFFIAFIPQFVTPDKDLFQQIVVIVLTWVIADVACKLLYGLLAKSLRPLLLNGNNMTFFNKASGALYIFAGIAVSVQGSNASVFQTG